MNLMKYITIFATYLCCFCFCQSPQSLANIQISFENNGTHTTFTLTSSSGANKKDFWMAVGLNNDRFMVNKLLLSF